MVGIEENAVKDFTVLGARIEIGGLALALVVPAGGECRHAAGKSREPRFSRLGAEPRPAKPKDANWQRSADHGNETPDAEPRPRRSRIHHPNSSRPPILGANQGVRR